MLNSSFIGAVRSLNFQEDRRAELHSIDPSEWPELLKLTDRSQITLPLGIRRRDDLPDSVRNRIDRNLSDNAARHQRLFAEYRLIADALQARSIDFVVLKGLSQIAPFYVNDFVHRPQYDIDLYSPPEFLDSARDALMSAGFAPIQLERKRTDHLPAMIRNRDWKWRGDYYDPDLPLTVELHFRFWDRNTERFPACIVDHFWRRRTSRKIHGIEIPMLSLADGASYSALHLVRHLLRGDIRVYHVYELAHFLHQTQGEYDLWEDWLDRRSGVSIVEAVAFRLASDWFGCKMHPIVEETVKNLPRPVARWFELFAYSPLALERPNKDELFLHLSLVESMADRCAILLRRVLPLNVPKLVGPGSPDRKQSVRAGLCATLRKWHFVVSRAVHHLRTFVPLLHSAFRWRIAKRKYAVS